MLTLGIIILSLLLLGFTRFGVRAARRADGSARVILRAGFIRVDLLKQIRRQKKKSTAVKKDKKERKRMVEILLRTWRPILRSLRKGVRVDRLILNLALAGGDDPCAAAITYGRLWAVWGILRPALTENLRVRKERVDMRLDFELEKTVWDGEIALTISLGRSIAALLTVLYAAVKPKKQSIPRKAV